MVPRVLQTAEDRRTDVIAAALSEFSARGYFGANTTEIARAAGISQAYLYRLYTSKEALFIAVLAEVARRIREDLDLVLRSASSAAAAEEALVARAVPGREEAALLLQAVAACSVPVIAAAVRDCYADQWTHLRGRGLRDAAIRDYLARAQFTTAMDLAAFPPGDEVARALAY